ncbi:mediator of RNA polymerase II transcription subunit 7-like [Scaptodrosophila lebanonensis]|uniref:Mediator of RNA polymerase II transcription subunit 7 n=1 Tax=Drosophila lebanonensis TaxID=7225 RepID=A0A6J2TZK7_DROLE|nr:mediator of RNA polymerase II transcription subunit 7-like [Scaptodrosophila lebanonensis]
MQSDDIPSTSKGITHRSVKDSSVSENLTKTDTVNRADLEQVSSLPLPPKEYFKNYSNKAVAKGLAPPPPPAPSDNQNITVFGIQHNSNELVCPLESQNIKRIVPVHFDRRKELTKLNHSLVVTFLDLLDTLIMCPEHPKRREKLDHINLLFVQMNHLINELRPHQARETLRVMMELQKRQRVETISRFQDNLKHVRDILKSGSLSVPADDDDDDDDDDDEEVEESATPKLSASAADDPRFEKDFIMCKIVDEIE